MSLAHISVIKELHPIEGADRIKRTVVDGWTGVVSADTKVGDEVIVFLPDAIVPEKLEFMRRHNFRVKIQRLRGCPSEVLIVSIKEFPELLGLEPGTDVTELLKVTKYEKVFNENPDTAPRGDFPWHLVPRTDEVNFQKVPQFRAALIGKNCYVAVKYDGTSQTFYRNGEHTGSCSRNLELHHHHPFVEKYKLIERVTGDFALQWECVGPGIQKNPLGLKEREPRLFDVYDIRNKCYVDLGSLKTWADYLEMPMVEHYELIGDIWDDDELRAMSAGKYPNGHEREGIVIRPVGTTYVNGSRLSFKVINPDYGA